MDFAILLAILPVLGSTFAYDTYDDFAEDIPRPDGYMDSIVSLEDSSQSVLENPLQIALSRIYEIKRKEMNLPSILFVKRFTSITEPMNQAGNFMTTIAYREKINEITNYGPIPRKFTEHELSTGVRESFGHRTKSNKENEKNPKNRKFEYKQQTSYNTMGEILKLKRQHLNTSSLLLRFKWPKNKNSQTSYRYYLEDVYVLNNFSKPVNSTTPQLTMETNYKNKTPQWTPVTFVVHKNLSTVFKSNNRGKIRKANTTKKRVDSRREVEKRPNVLGLEVEIWRSEKLTRKQEMARKMLLQ